MSHVAQAFPAPSPALPSGHNRMSSQSSQYTSPNAIPPRTSSNGGMSPTPVKAVLQPLPEGSWISNHSNSTIIPGKKPNVRSSSPTYTSLPAAPGDGDEDPNHFTSTKYNDHPLSVPPWSDKKENVLLAPYDYLFSHPGKDIRAQFIMAFNEWLNVPAPALAIITKVIGMLHTASLLVDDIEDGSVLRRGLPVAHSIFGTAQTINSANYVYFEALQELLKLDMLEDVNEKRKRGEAVRIYTEELVNLHRGQGMDLFWRDTLTVPTEEEYLEMVGNKTGGLFRLAIRLMQAESSSDRDCVPLINLLGTLFQIRDDYMNLLSTTYSTNKGLCEDLTEGKFSFPILHAIRSDPTNLVLLNILKQKPDNDDIKRYAVKYMESKGSFDYCKEVVSVLLERSKKEVERIDAGEGKRGILKILGSLDLE